MKNNPETRFREFDEEWKPSTLSNIVTRIKRKNEELTSDRVLTISAQYGLIDQKDFFNKRIASSLLQGYYLMKKGEFAYNKSYSSEYPVGAVKRLKKYDWGVLSTLYILFTINDESLAEWVEAFFESSKWHNEITKRASEGARNHGLLNISPTDFFDLPFCYPSTHDEQHKIAQFFSRLDSLITAEDKKLERLKTIKSASLEKMFPKQGETVSEVRFKGFTGEWMESRIGDCFSERKERSGIGEMLSVTINSGVRKARELDRTVHIGDTSNYKVVRQGDIAYNSMRMWQGASGYSQYDGIVSPAYTVIIPNERIDSRFFACLFKTQYMIHVFELNSQGLTSDTWNLKYGQLRSILVRYPVDVKEQIYIAEYFSRLDTLISAQEQKSEKLRSLKKSFLEKMFVSTPK